MEHLSALLRDGLRELGWPAESAAVARWEALARLLEGWNQRINLTGHRDAEAIARRLLLEAAAFARVLPGAASIADIGSGAGIPGLPIALCRPDTHVLLVEAREKRHHFQRAAIRELGLDNAEPIRGRADALEPRRCEGAVAQALSAPAEALELMRPWVASGGWLALATTADRAVDATAISDLAGSERRPYAAPGAGPARSAWIGHLQPSADDLPSI